MTERPTIFVSGVSSEFRTFRQAVRDVLLAKDIFPIVQDSFPPDYRQVRQMLTKHISKSDAVICLVGFAYGAEPHNRPESEARRSYTQLEYHIARELNKPTFVFLSDEKTRPCDDAPAEDAERQNLQRVYRAAVGSGDELWHVFEARDQLLTLIAEIPIVAQAAFRISSGRLRHGAQQELVGREKELGNLDKAWDDPKTHVATIVAWGGVGKTALVVEWMARLARDGWRGAERMFDWSFYSQGTREQGAASADTFIAAALEFFGGEEGRQLAASPTSPWDKGAKLAQLVGERRALLVLDGVEPLQYPPGPVGGKLKDPALEALLKGLALHSAGLCIVTTRESVTDLKPYRDTTAPEWLLGHLSEEAGAQLLFDAGVKRAGNAQIKADDKELKDTAREVGGHALTLQLLGGYLAKGHNGDVRKRNLVRFEKADAKVQGGHAFKVMGAYEQWLTRAEEEGKRQLAVLHLLGLFDCPADSGCIAALREKPPIEGLTESLTGLNNDDWNFTLANLVECRLISRRESRSEISDPRSAIDCHPLMREYFARQLRKTNADAWRAGHRRLYEHLCATTTDKKRNPTLEDLQPLYQAVAHACQAGMQQEACDKVYYNRILRGRKHYTWRKLGAFSAEVAVQACFFVEPWCRLSPLLSEPAQAWLLNETSFSLRALGRLTEAIEPMRAALQIGVKQRNWKAAATRAGNLSGLESLLGEIGQAIADAEDGVAYADKSREQAQRRDSRSILASALHQAGRHAEAEARFREADEMQNEGRPAYPLLYSLVGFPYCELLLSMSERTAWQRLLDPKCEIRDLRPAESCLFVERFATQALKREESLYSAPIVDFALYHLTLGRVALYYRAISEHMEIRCPELELETAVASLRRAGRQDHLPGGLVARAWLRGLSGDAAGACSDLDEAWEIAERGSMKLLLADVHLYRARLFHGVTPYPWDKDEQGRPRGAKDDLAAARKLIEQCGYHRRDEELADAEKAIGITSKPKDGF